MLLLFASIFQIDSTLIRASLAEKDSHRHSKRSLYPLSRLFLGPMPLNYECEKWLNPHQDICQDRYDRLLEQEYRRQLKFYGMEENFLINVESESAKRVRCCGIWQAMRCVASHVDDNFDTMPVECPLDLAHKIQSLPTDREIKSQIYNYCSEYRANSAICNSASKHFPPPSLLLLSLVILLLY